MEARDERQVMENRGNQALNRERARERESERAREMERETKRLILFNMYVNQAAFIG